MESAVFVMPYLTAKAISPRQLIALRTDPLDMALSNPKRERCGLNILDCSGDGRHQGSKVVPGSGETCTEI